MRLEKLPTNHEYYSACTNEWNLAVKAEKSLARIPYFHIPYFPYFASMLLQFNLKSSKRITKTEKLIYTQDPSL